MTIGRDPIPPSPCRWTKDQYDHMDEMGWFVDKHVELIAGEITEEGRMTQPHWVGVSAFSKDEMVSPLATPETPVAVFALLP